MRVRAIAFALLIASAVFVVENVAIVVLFPTLPRVTTDFSATYLRRTLDAYASGPSRVVLLGDSVLWGYRLAAVDTAPSLLARAGCRCANLAFKSANPPNYYLLARLLVQRRVPVAVAVVEINEQVLNAANSTYASVHPGVAALAAPYLHADERASLSAAGSPVPAPQRWDAMLSAAVPLYGMRTDLRETFYGEPPAAPPPDVLEGLYDLSPLDERNVGVAFLARTLATFHAAGVPVLAFLTPVNHRLMHAFIDVREYRANLAYVRRLCERNGARVLDLDGAFPPELFFDNDHLTARGQRRLAQRLRRAIDTTAPRSGAFAT